MGNIPEAMVAVSRIEDIFLSIQIIGQDPLQYIDEFFPFVCGKYEIHSVFTRSDIDQERFHMAARLVL